LETPSPTRPLPHWKAFELLTAAIQRELAPQATVTPNAKLPGLRSKTTRQIDVLVEQDVGQHHLRIVLDCKDHQDSVDVKGIEEFMGLVADVGAHKGAMVAAKGFTEAAKERARDAGIDLFRVIDVADHKWKTYVTIPALTRDYQIAVFTFTLGGTGGFVSLDVNQDFRFMPIFREDGSLIDYACNLVLDRWEDRTIPPRPGWHMNLQLTTEATFVEGPDKCRYKIDIRTDVEVREVLHFGNIELINARGFKDEITDVAHLTGRITTARFNFEEIQRNWRRIDQLEQLAVKPVIQLRVSSTYPRYSKEQYPSVRNHA
jgi:hypothetical protein